MQKLKKGDKVRVLLGKDRGKEETIERLIAKDGLVYVTGVNMYKRHVKKSLTQTNQGQIMEVIKPLNISNVALICPNCQKMTRVGFEKTQDGKIRICRKCQKKI